MMQSTNKQRTLFIVAAIAVFIFALQTALFPVRASNDVWWHLKTGQYLTETGPLFPQHDIFSQTGADEEWVNHEWLSDILFYKAYKWTGGIAGLVAIKALFFALTGVLIFILATRRSGSLLLSLAICMAAIWASRHSLLTRPPLLSYLLVPTMLAALQHCWEKRITLRAVIPLLLLVALWANLHGSVILAVIITGAFAFSALVLKKDPLRWIGLGFLIAFAMLANPWGWKIPMLTFKVGFDPILNALIPELLPPQWWPHSIIFAIMIVAGMSILLPTFRKKNLPQYLFLLFILIQACQHVRHVPLAALTLALVAAGSWPDFKERCSLPKHYIKHVYKIALLALIAVTLFGSHRLWQTRNYPYFKFDGLVEAAYPVEVCDFILKAKLPGPMLNEDVNYAGYLIWRLSPDPYRVYTDSRFDIHGSDPACILSSLKAANDGFTVEKARQYYNPVYSKSGDAMDQMPYWQAIIQWQNPGFIITSIVPRDKNHKLYYRLSEKGSGWAKVFDIPARIVEYHPSYSQHPWILGGYAIFVRDNEENADNIKAWREIWLQERQKWSG
jgi:hypothetical protein